VQAEDNQLSRSELERAGRPDDDQFFQPKAHRQYRLTLLADPDKKHSLGQEGHRLQRLMQLVGNEEPFVHQEAAECWLRDSIE